MRKDKKFFAAIAESALTEHINVMKCVKTFNKGY